MGDSRTSITYQRLASTFDTFLESPEVEIAAIPVVRPESVSKGNSGDIQVPLQELVYGGKEAGVETSDSLLDRHNELLS
ncbi:hypothetical protein O181_096634 [Austropuccinia psidii MF-1]|uniref:Uncharacterized protein n=1 Tax=Austropuccinia psidii MF-1 TaxID=1389203 RepID=A0A9Q3J7E2_9BASI|nr:hypothetical protein [Austropuccinia psidii MF-1]